jgi:hypothetical protein
MSEKKSGVKCTEDKVAKKEEKKKMQFSVIKGNFLSAIERWCASSDFCTWENVKRM